ncbi:MAG: ATP-dependent helicase [Sphingobacteriales bacterium]|nr:MAG: ATP-dependent helicase [Sphingobacteriales bacterium]
MIINEQLFLQRYNNLNDQQREAVDAIYGPVMVIAGPGTGKTEVLSVRIANLLRSEAQVQPNEILCLTYTDEATNSMRNRLTQIIGTAAHRVNIVTFHAFCNNVIQANSENFSLRSLQPITDLERTELLYEIFETLPQGHVLRKLSGNIYYDAGRLNRLFDFMKREHLSAADIHIAVGTYIDSLPEREEYVYKRAGKGFAKGDLKQAAIDDEIRKMSQTRAAASLYEIYNERMREMGRYDFNDMIVWVLEEFKNNPALLQNYQERYQFILVDEFQDTNGAQNELINELTQFWDDPNLFVVGDDDQSIYEFQGARIRNIIDFYQKFKETIQVIVLPQNYRSSQPILNKATATIQNNLQRLIYQLKDLQLDKNIVASHPRFADGKDTVQPSVTAYSNVVHEEADVLMQIEQLRAEGIPLNEVAIIYAQHKQADNIMALMDRVGIPYSVKKQVNILELPLIQQIINLLRYLDDEKKTPYSAEHTLFSIMHTPYYGIDPTDIAMIALYIQANKAKDKSLGYWRLVLSNGLLLESLNLKSVEALRRLGDNINNWMRLQQELPVPLLIEHIFHESGIVQHLLNEKDHIWQMQVLHTFFDFVRETYARNHRTGITELLRMIDRMQLENISVPVQKIIQNENGIKLYTAHGAKGNEFEYVYLIGCTKNFWETRKGAGNEYKLPDTITSTDDDADKTYKTEVARRLFYVALTRARKMLHVSYAVADNQGKPLEHSVFIDEISTPDERVNKQVTSEEVIKHIAWAMQPVPDVRIALANHKWIDHALQQFVMSYTTLSKYLRCPLSYYYETLLRVPFLKNDALAYGSALHYALERMFKIMKERNGEFPSKQEVIDVFRIGMYTEQESFTQLQYDRRLEQGETSISDYYDKYINSFSTNVEIEFKVPRYLLDGVPVTGKIDKIEFDGDNCTVVDYKTGDPDRSAAIYTAPPNEKEPLGGDYWRQMVFYKLILENYSEKNWKVTMGMFDYVEKGRTTGQYKQPKVPVFPQDETTVRQQMKQAYAGIMNHEFDKGCGKPDCYWCNFAREYKLVKQEDTVEIDDI